MVMGSIRQSADLVVIGAGPGGYVAAIHAANLGLDVVLVEERAELGGVCLLEGCIPSKALINAVEVAEEARHAASFGVTFDGLRIDPDKLRSRTEGIVEGLSKGVRGLLKRRGVEVIHGRARFDGPTSLAITGADVAGIDFKACIIATGSSPNPLPPAGATPVWTSTEALAVPRVPKHLVIVGGGYIGLELGTVYAGLGSRITMVEFMPELLFGADDDLVKVVVDHAKRRFDAIMVDTKVTGVDKDGDLYRVTVDKGGATETIMADQVLAAVGRRPNTQGLGLEAAGIEVDARGFIPVDEEGRTTAPGVFAIGDVTPGPMLAHKASREAKVVAEVIAAKPSAFDNRAIPAVVFTDPELAWAGLTEKEAKAKGVEVTVGKFPLSALGRARTMGRTDGLVKVLADPATGLVLGVGMVGPLASELIAEATLAIEMGATLEDLMVTIHPHPTVSEAIVEAAEVAAGMPIHINPPRRR